MINAVNIEPDYCSFVPIHGVRKSRSRTGLLLSEALVAVAILTSAFALVSSLAVRCGRLSQRCRHDQAALDELSNQLDRLVSLPPSARDAAVNDLRPSDFAQRALASPALTVSRTRQDEAERLTMRIAWDRAPGDRRTLALVAWTDPAESNANGGPSGDARSPVQTQLPSETSSSVETPTP